MPGVVRPVVATTQKNSHLYKFALALAGGIVVTYLLARGRGGIGRRVRFRSVWEQSREGSSPFARTTISQAPRGLFLLPDSALFRWGHAPLAHFCALGDTPPRRVAPRAWEVCPQEHRSVPKGRVPNGTERNQVTKKGPEGPERSWCGRKDLNLHGIAPIRT